MEGLQDAREGGEEDDTRKEEGDLAGVRGLIEGGIPVFGEEGEEVVYGICAREGGRRGPPATEGGEGRGEDAVEAVEGEEVGDEKEEAAGGRAGAVLLVATGVEECEGSVEGAGHGFEAGDFKEESFSLLCVGVASDAADCFLEETFGWGVGHFALERT